MSRVVARRSRNPDRVGREGQSAGEGRGNSPWDPGVLSSFKDTEMEFSQVTQRRRLTLTKMRMKIYKFISEAVMFSRVGAFISPKYSLIVRSSQVKRNWTSEDWSAWA